MGCAPHRNPFPDDVARRLFRRICNQTFLQLGDVARGCGNRQAQWTADHIRSVYSFRPKKLVVVPRGVDPVAFDPRHVAHDRIAQLRAQWNAREDETVILFPGRLSRRKGQLILVEAIARIAGEFGKLRVVIVGEATRRDEYAAEIARSIERHGLTNTVTIAGHVQDMPAAYLAADIVVFTTIEPEGFGRVAAEASAMERPVIAADHGGTREIVVTEKQDFSSPGRCRCPCRRIANIAASRRGRPRSDGRARSRSRAHAFYARPHDSRHARALSRIAGATLSGVTAFKEIYLLALQWIVAETKMI